MNQVREILIGNWFSILLLAVAVGIGAKLLVSYSRRRRLSLRLIRAGAAAALLGVGGLFLPFSIALWGGAAALAILFGMLLVVITSGAWWAPLGYALGAALCLAIGGVGNETVTAALTDAGKMVVSLEPTQPWWLLLLGLIPFIVLISYRSLAGLGPVRRWVAIGLRCALVLFLTLALAEVRLRHQNEAITVMFLVDRSFSIPVELDNTASPDTNRSDRRSDRIEQFVNDAVLLRGPLHKADRAGLILFGRRPRLELPASTAPSFNFRMKDAASPVDGNYTDIGAAIKLALASFPEGTGKRIVLLSDGNENLGHAEEQARLAKLNGVQIDVVPLAANYRNENEVLVQGVEAPPKTEQGSRLPIRVLVRSYNPRTVLGTLVLKQITDGETVPVAPSPMKVRVRPGLNPFTFKQPLTNQQQSYTYQAIFQPEAVETEQGGFIAGLEGDRVQNNSATTHVVALGQRRILVIEQEPGQHQLLIDRLKEMANSKYKVHAITPARLPEGKDELGVFLSNYDSVIVANVPAELLNSEQQEMLRSNTRDQGCGFIMIGGPDSFGAGGWQGTPVEEMLPVDCEIKSFKVQAKGGLVMIMHACEMADGNMWEKKIAKLAIDKLSPNDAIGIIQFDWGGHKWHIPLQEIGKKKKTLLGLVDRMMPGDMPDFDGPLRMAYDGLTDPAKELATKHIIVITDGDPQLSDSTILPKLKKAGISMSTVGVATHGVNEDKKLLDMASGAAKGGKFYKVTNPRALPQIYVKETRLVSQSFVHAARFVPRLLFKDGPTEKMPDALNPLWGFVRTTPKQSPLVEISIVGPPAPDQDFPILAYWHYGLGKSVAFTSDARSQPTRPAWDREWAGSDMYSKFWEQAVEWSLRPTETGRMAMMTEYNDGRVKVTVDARDDKNRPLTDLILRGGVTSPLGKVAGERQLELKFEQKNSGLYEAEFKADEAGSYFVNAQAVRMVKKKEKDKEVVKEESIDSVRSGVTIPYSPEFADLESNTALMDRLADMTGGKRLGEDLLAKAADPKDPEAGATRSQLAASVFREGLPQFKNLQPIWFWLVLFAGVGLFFDVAVRRIAVQPAEVAVVAERVWGKLRGRAVMAAQTPQFIDRLKSRKAQVSEALEQLRAAKRFEAGDRSGTAPIVSDEADMAAATATLRRPTPQQRIAPDAQQEAADYASRLLKAKKRVWQEREKENES